jgi:hypothetical protein
MSTVATRAVSDVMAPRSSEGSVRGRRAGTGASYAADASCKGEVCSLIRLIFVLPAGVDSGANDGHHSKVAIN